jgi:hypothetical protein
MMNTPQTTTDRTATRLGQYTVGRELSACLADGAAAGRNRLLAWLAGLLRSAGDQLFSADDARAIARGWQIAPGKRGLSRTYRDPRFDALASCDQCHGSGGAADQSCARCSGTGRVTLTAPKVSTQGGRRVA